MSFIVIEGLDGSGKGTQIEKLYNFMWENNVNVKKVTFPDYSSPSSALVKMYLKGDFGTDADSVNPYAASSFYAVDRFASYTTGWKQHYLSGGTVIADRYTTSNIVYQLSKMDEEHWDEFIEWIEDFEYSKMGLPKPDSVIYLDVPPEVSQKLLMKRYSGNEEKKDIHEKNVEFLIRCRKCAYYAAKKLCWKIISCAENGEIRSVDSIHREIISLINK